MRIFVLINIAQLQVLDINVMENIIVNAKLNCVSFVSEARQLGNFIVFIALILRQHCCSHTFVRLVYEDVFAKAFPFLCHVVIVVVPSYAVSARVLQWFLFLLTRAHDILNKL